MSVGEEYKIFSGKIVVIKKAKFWVSEESTWKGRENHQYWRKYPDVAVIRLFRQGKGLEYDKILQE